MDRVEFFNRVASRARERYGVGITERQVRDWIDEDVIPGPIPRGRRREWGHPSQYRRALEICRHIAQGADRYSDIRFRQWLAGRAVPFDLLRQDVKSEFARLRKNLFRPLMHDLGPTDHGKKEKKRLKVVTRRMGEPSAVIVPQGFEYTKDELFRLYDAMRFGKGGVDFHAIVREILARFGLPESLLSASPSFIDDMAIGLAGDPDEIAQSAEETIESVRPEQFAEVQAWSSWLRWVLRYSVDIFSAAHPSTSVLLSSLRPVMTVVSGLPTNPWGFSIFVQCLHWAHRNPEASHALSEMSRCLLPAIRRIFNRFESDGQCSLILVDSNPAGFLLLLATPKNKLGAEEITVRPKLIRRLWHHGVSDLVRARRRFRHTSSFRKRR